MRRLAPRDYEAIQLQLYREFYERNTELFHKDIQEYWYAARRYIAMERPKRVYGLEELPTPPPQDPTMKERLKERVSALKERIKR